MLLSQSTSEILSLHLPKLGYFCIFTNSKQVTDETVIWSIIVWWSVTSTNYDWFFKRFYFNRYNITSNEFKMVFLTIKCFLYITLLLHIQHYNHYEELSKDMFIPDKYFENFPLICMDVFLFSLYVIWRIGWNSTI